MVPLYQISFLKKFKKTFVVVWQQVFAFAIALWSEMMNPCFILASSGATVASIFAYQPEMSIVDVHISD